MNYGQDLTVQLRMRGRTEAEIAEIIREVHTHGTDRDTLTDEFGTPQEYAASFDRRKRKTLGSRITAAAVLLALAWALGWIAVAVVRRYVLDIDPPMEGVMDRLGITLGALAIGGTGLVTGFLVDYLRPPAETVPRKP